MALDVFRALLWLAVCSQVAVAPSGLHVFPVNGPRQCFNSLTNGQCLEHATANGEYTTLYWDDASYPPGCTKRSSPYLGRTWQFNNMASSTVLCDASGIENCECKGDTYVEMYSHATCEDAGYVSVADGNECETAAAGLGRTFGSSFSTTTGNAPYYPLEPCMVRHH